jgi:UDP-glucose 4-epimerase
MVRADVRAVAFSSSCATYGEPDCIPIVESARAEPINPYGFTKLACERMLDDFDRPHGLKSVRLRYFNAAAPIRLAKSKKTSSPETHLIPLVLDTALGRISEVQVLGTDYQKPDGTAIRD